MCVNDSPKVAITVSMKHFNAPPNIEMKDVKDKNKEI